jgi:molybdate transport system substrate-binding protein
MGGLCLIPGLASAQTGPVQIYAAMTFRPALDAVLASYREAGGNAIAVYGPTPVLVHQLENGAPADILLTADSDWMNQASQHGLIQPDTRANLLANDLVLAGTIGGADAGTLTAEFKLIDWLGGGRLAMCDPEHDPAGRYAKQSLQALGFWDAVSDHIAIAESSLAAVTLLDRGEVPAAMCFATDVHSDGHAMIAGRFPAASHAPIVYPAALTRAGDHPQAAATLGYLRSGRALSIFTRFGYQAA